MSNQLRLNACFGEIKYTQMKKIVIIYGLIAGAIVSALMHLTMIKSDGQMNFDGGMLLGYLTMIIALAMIFFGVKVYRDKHMGGTITFGKAFVVGLYITIVASVVYCVNWEIMLNTSASGFMDQYTTYYIEKMEAEGASVTEIEEMREEMASMSEMYKNPVARFGMTFLEIFPVGLVISLISAALLKKGDVLPAAG